MYSPLVEYIPYVTDCHGVDVIKGMNGSYIHKLTYLSLVPSRSTRTHKGKERLVDIETKLGPKTSYPVLVECNLRAR